MEISYPKNAKIMITTERLKQKTISKLIRNNADDIRWATTAKQRITYIKETTPSTPTKRNRVINESKTEEYEIIRQGNEKWRKNKLLGCLLDTKKDINRRKILAIDAFKTHE